MNDMLFVNDIDFQLLHFSVFYSLLMNKMTPSSPPAHTVFIQFQSPGVNSSEVREAFRMSCFQGHLRSILLGTQF